MCRFSFLPLLFAFIVLLLLCISPSSAAPRGFAAKRRMRKKNLFGTRVVKTQATVRKLSTLKQYVELLSHDLSQESELTPLPTDDQKNTTKRHLNVPAGPISPSPQSLPRPKLGSKQSKGRKVGKQRERRMGQKKERGTFGLKGGKGGKLKDKRGLQEGREAKDDENQFEEIKNVRQQRREEGGDGSSLQREKIGEEEVAAVDDDNNNDERDIYIERGKTSGVSLMEELRLLQRVTIWRVDARSYTNYDEEALFDFVYGVDEEYLDDDDDDEEEFKKDDADEYQYLFPEGEEERNVYMMLRRLNDETGYYKEGECLNRYIKNEKKEETKEKEEEELEDDQMQAPKCDRYKVNINVVNLISFELIVFSQGTVEVVGFITSTDARGSRDNMISEGRILQVVETLMDVKLERRVQKKTKADRKGEKEDTNNVEEKEEKISEIEKEDEEVITLSIDSLSGYFELIKINGDSPNVFGCLVLSNDISHWRVDGLQLRSYKEGASNNNSSDVLAENTALKKLDFEGEKVSIKDLDFMQLGLGLLSMNARISEGCAFCDVTSCGEEMIFDIGLGLKERYTGVARVSLGSGDAILENVKADENDICSSKAGQELDGVNLKIEKIIKSADGLYFDFTSVPWSVALTAPVKGENATVTDRRIDMYFVKAFSSNF